MSQTTWITTNKKTMKTDAQDAEDAGATGVSCWTISMVDFEDHGKVLYRVKEVEDAILYLSSKLKQYKEEKKRLLKELKRGKNGKKNK